MGTENTRKLASIRRITSIQPIENADAIEVATVDGWNIVVKKGEFKVGDLAVYIEIDSWVPHELAPFLSKGKEPREYNGVKGERLRTIKLRGQVSQGLLLSIEGVFFGADRNFWWSQLGVDVSEKLGIQKWEAPIPAQLAGKARGTFPTSLIQKTDQERCCDANTILITKDGHKTIKEVCDTIYKGEVLSFNHETGDLEYKKIVNHSIMTRKVNNWLVIKTKSGKEIRVTNNHKIYMPDLGCYREAQYLKVGDMVNILS